MVSASRRARRWGAYAALGIAVSLGIAALGHAETGDRRTGRSATNQGADAYQRGSDALPVVVKVQGAETPANRAADHAEDVSRHDTDQGWAVKLGVASILAALIQAAVLIWQIFYLGRTLDHERKSSERQLRAYVFVDDTEFSWSRSGKEWGAQFSYRNAGSTPAYDVVVKSGLALHRVSDPEPAWKIDNTFPIGLIGPNGDKFWDEAFFDEVVPGYHSLRGMLKGGTHEVFLYGRIDYVDEFDQPRWTEFRYSVGGELGYEDFEMSACREGNRTERSERRNQTNSGRRNRAHGASDFAP